MKGHVDDESDHGESAGEVGHRVDDEPDVHLRVRSQQTCTRNQLHDVNKDEEKLSQNS
jgi:hypothetical protein